MDDITLQRCEPSWRDGDAADADAPPPETAADADAPPSETAAEAMPPPSLRPSSDAIAAIAAAVADIPPAPATRGVTTRRGKVAGITPGRVSAAATAAAVASIDVGTAVRVRALCHRPPRSAFALWVNHAQVLADMHVPPLFLNCVDSSYQPVPDAKPIKGWKVLQQNSIAFGGQWAKSVKVADRFEMANGGPVFEAGTHLLKVGW
jgi:hypothetical protein